MSVFRHKVASSEKLRLAFVKLWRENPHKFWSPSQYNGSSDDEEDAYCVRGAENTASEPGSVLGGGHLWNINRYHRQLEYAAKYLNMQTNGQDKVLVVNLGPSNPSDSLLRTIFDNHVVDLPEAYHEMPPGTGVLPLDVLFSLCSCIKSWLELSEENVVLLHLRSSAGSGMETLKFVKYCFMAYNGNHEDADNQFSSFMGRSSKVPPGSQASIAGIGGPSQQRYSKYFLHILFSPSPPEEQQKVLAVKKIVFDGVNTLRRARNAKVLEHLVLYTPYLVVYQRGVEQWKGQPAERGSTVEFNVETSVAGDVVIGLWFIKDVLVQGQSPTIAFAFHCGFMKPGEFSFSSGRLDLNSAAVAGDLTMRIIFEETTSPVDNGILWCALRVGIPSVGTNIHEMRQIWQEQQQAARRATHVDPLALSTEPEEEQASPLPLSFAPFHSESLAPGRSINALSPVDDFNAATKENSSSGDPSRIRAIEMVDMGVGCSLGSSDDCSEQDALVREETVVADTTPPSGEEEAPSTPSTTEIGLIRVGFTDQQCIAGPSPSCNVGDSGGNAVSPGKRKVGQPPAPPPPPPGRLRGTKIPPPPPALANKASSERTLVRTRSFYWTKTPKQSGTIWCELTNNDQLPEAISQKLYNMFGPNEGRSSPSPGNLPSRAQSPEIPRSGGVKVVSTGRATNVSIMMNRFKTFDGGLEGLCKAVLSGKGLLVEDFKLLSQIAPREDEIRAFNDYGGATHELSSAEQTLVQMCEIPRLKQKAHCWVMVDNWETNYKKATNMLHVTKLACQEIKDSGRLKSVLEVVLTVGNSMNKGTHRGNAGGCRVESLLKLADTKVTGYSSGDPRRANLTRPKLPSSESPVPGDSAEDEIFCLLDFVAMVVQEQQEDDAQNLLDPFLLGDIVSLSEANNYLDGSVEELLEEVREGFEAIELEIEAELGEKWPKLQSLSHEDVQKMVIREKGTYATEEREFIFALHNFLQGTMENRGRLRREHSVCEQFLKSAATWLGEPEAVNPRRVLRDLFQFAKVFDDSYRRLGP